MAAVADVKSTVPKLKKPISTGPPPLTEYDAKYVERKAAIVEKTLQLKNGHHFCYFTEGSPTDPAVLVLHGFGESKWSYVFPEPLSGIFLIAVDRMGHGKSTPHKEQPDFTQIVPEYMELLDELKVDKVYVFGHSMGGLASCQIAAAKPDRVLGIAPMSAPMFTHDKRVSN